MSNTTKATRPKSKIKLLLAIVATIVLSIAGILLFAFVILPNLISTSSIKAVVESSLNEALNNSPAKRSIAGASTSEINPFFQELNNRDLSYRWKTGEVYAYEFSMRIGDETKSTFKVQGDCQYTIGNERIVDENRSGTGTAFAIAPGYVATCAHVVQVAERLTFVVDEKRYAARIVDVDHANDLAILAYEGVIKPVELGNSTNLELAESVLVIGFPLAKVLGEGIKVSAGIVSGIDQTQGGRAIAIDGAINPGNSGGPVINQKGQVVGIASATLQGERINTVGFASRVDALLNLMTKNKIPIKQSSVDEVLEAKEITKRTAPSVGLLEVDGWADNRCQDIDYLATFSGNINSPVVIFNGIRSAGLRGKMTLSRLGEVRSVSNAEQLPFVLASIPELLIQPFDIVAKDKWKLFRNYELQAQQRNNGQFIGQSIHSQLRDRLLGREPVEKQSAGKQPGIPADMKSEFEVVSGDKEIVRIKKFRHLHVPGKKSSLDVKGEGVWVFDVNQGVPISLEENLRVFNNVEGKSTETPLVIKISRVDPTIVQERLRLAQEQADKQKKEQEVEQTQPNPALIDELVTKVNEQQTIECMNVLSRLTKVAIVEEKRDAVLKSLRGVIGSKELALHGLGWNAYRHWMNDTCAPELRRVISRSSEHRDNAVNALFELKLEEDVPLFLANLSELSISAKKSLSSFGPKIEAAVLERLTAERDTFAQIDLLRLLEDIGTEKSVSRLNELKKDDDRGFRIRIDSTIRSINRRLERNKKEN